MAERTEAFRCAERCLRFFRRENDESYIRGMSKCVRTLLFGSVRMRQNHRRGIGRHRCSLSLYIEIERRENTSNKRAGENHSRRRSIDRPVSCFVNLPHQQTVLIRTFCCIISVDDSARFLMIGALKYSVDMRLCCLS